jgi:glycosyltransferase involved in cell wall biosynthesis
MVAEKIRQVGGPLRAISLFFSLVRSSGLKAVNVTVIHALKSREADTKITYNEWAHKFIGHSPSMGSRLLQKLKRSPTGPLISIIMPTFNSVRPLLQEAVNSVLSQTYPNWELVIVDDASSKKSTVRYLRQLAKVDPRVRVIFRSTNGHISRASNDGINVATGEYLCFLDHDDLLVPDALETFIYTLARDPGIRFAYSDEDKVDVDGKLSEPHFKPDLNRTLALSYNYFCHLSFYKTELIQELGGLRSEFDGAQDYDLALRVLAVLSDSEIHHIAKVLYHWRKTKTSTALNNGAKSYASQAGRRAVQDHLSSTLVDGAVVPNPEIPMYNRVIFSEYEKPLVSIVIPTRDHVELLRMCIKSILAKTSYSNYEILVVDNDSEKKNTLKYFEEIQTLGIRVIKAPGEFNYSKINNLAVSNASGEYICLLNNDIEVKSRNWLSELVSHAQRPGIGAVGARLWYPNGQLQQGGVVLGLGGISGVAGHAHKYSTRDEPGYMGRAKVAQEFSAVTAACLLVKKSAYLEVDGLTEELKVAFNDVDFCLKLLKAGYKNVWTPFAELVHHESISRGIDTSKSQILRAAEEVLYMRRNWADLLDNDPAYNRHLTRNHEDFSLAWPPRRKSNGTKF